MPARQRKPEEEQQQPLVEQQSPEPDPIPEQQEEEPTEKFERLADRPSPFGRQPTVQQAVADAMRIMRAVGKWGQNTQQNYKFRSIDDLMTAANEALGKAGVVVAPKVLQRIVDDTHKTGSNNVMRWVDLEVRYRVFGPAGDHYDVTMWGEARDAADKATSKALSAAFKYFLMETFLIPTVDLPDVDASHLEASAPGEEQQQRQQARSERRQAERAQQPQQQGQQPAGAPQGQRRVATGEEIMNVLQNAASKRQMGAGLAALPGAFVVETAPGKFAYDKARLREFDVVDAEATVMTAWEAIATFGAALPDEVHDPGATGGRYPSEADIPEPPASHRGPAQRKGPGEPDDDADRLWLSQPAEGANEEPGQLWHAAWGRRRPRPSARWRLRPMPSTRSAAGLAARPRRRGVG